MLHGKGLLTPIQQAFLTAFAELPDQAQFYLAGGTALAEFYLGHRTSFDLDFFTGQAPLVLPFSYQVETICPPHGLTVSVVRRFATFVEFLVVREKEQLKVDLALDAPFRFEPPLVTEYGIWANNLPDLQVDKLLAYYGRAEPRDAVDLYFILRQASIERLLVQAAQKDPGFDLYWFAVALNQTAGFPDEANRWPVKMLVPFDPLEIKRQFHDLALNLMSRLTNTSKEPGQQATSHTKE